MSQLRNVFSKSPVPAWCAALVFLALTVTLVCCSARTALAQPWSRDKVRSTATQAARYYHLSPAETRWIAEAAVDVVHDGAAESHGGKHVHTGIHRGMFQFRADSWRLGKRLARRARKAGHDHSHSWRCCRVCATYRFVKSYRDGGQAAIAKHWGATLGH